MSLDVSPDGKTIVFDLLGDLYTLPIAGGHATRITSGMAFDGQPRYAPDGQRIVFTSDRDGSDNVWIVDADGGNPRPVTTGANDQFMSPEWTPDGQSIVVTRVRRGEDPTSYTVPFDLWIYPAFGGDSGRQLSPAAPSTNSFLGAAFGPDPRLVYLSIGRVGKGFGAWQIGTLDRVSGHVDTLTSWYGSGMRPAVSPDGHSLVYAMRRDTVTALKLRDLRTGDERWLAPRVQLDAQDQITDTRDLLPGYAFSPTGQAIVISYGGHFWRVDVPSGRATPIPFTAQVEQQLGPPTQFEYPITDSALVVRQIRNVQLAPDGRRIAFTALDHLWIADLPSGAAPWPPGATIADARRLTALEAGESAPAWSPDGRYVAFVTWSDTAGGDVYRVRSDASMPPERLTAERAWYDKPSYTPDGAKLVVTRGPRRSRIEATDHLSSLVGAHGVELMWMPAAGGPLTHIAPIHLSASGYSPFPFYGRPQFAAGRSDRVYLYDPEDGLVSMRLDGSERKVLIKLTGNFVANSAAVRPEEMLLSPAGDRALVLINQRLYSVALPEAQQEPLTISLTDSTVSTTPSLPTQAVRLLTRNAGDFPAWSPDGRFVLHSLGAALYRTPIRAPDETAAIHVVIRAPKDMPGGVLVLRGERVVTMRGNEVVENADLVIRGNRIAAIGPRGMVPIPAGATVRDLRGMTIIPGYVDLHAHLRPAFGTHRTQVWEYLATLAYGTTTIRDPSTITTDVLTYGDLVETGALLGPRIFSTGPALSGRVIRNLDDALEYLRTYAEEFRTETLKQYVSGDRQVRQWVVMAARRLRLTPTTEGAGDFKLDLTQVIDGFAGLEHYYPTTPIYKDVAELTARSGVTHDPTLMTGFGRTAGSAGEYYSATTAAHESAKYRRFTPPEVADASLLRNHHETRLGVLHFWRKAQSEAKIVAAGGRVGAGSHGDYPGIGMHWELWALASGGLRPHDVLRAATIVGAEAIGHGKDLGSIAPGKLADLQVLDKNPLVDIHNISAIRYVMKNGRLYDAATLDELWPRQRRLPHQWWWESEPASAIASGIQ